MSVATRLATAVLAVSLGSLAAATIVGLDSGLDLGRRIYQERLGSLDSAGSFDIASAVNATSGLTTALAASPQASRAIDEFSAAYADLDLDGFDPSEASSALIEAYEDTYIAPDGADGRIVPVSDIVTRDPGALYLQSTYSIGDMAVDVVVDDPSLVENAEDGSEWTTVHQTFHPSYRRVVEDQGLLDLYLVSPDDARIVYSVSKGPDLGTSLTVGPFSGSVVATTVDQVLDDPSAGTAISDLSFYDAAPSATVGVMASPVFDGDELAGVLAITYDGAQLTAILETGVDDDVEADGIDDADVYMIGGDGTTRTDPRAYLDDPQVFLDESQASGLLSSADRAKIEAYGTTVLTQPVVDSTLNAAETGDDGVSETTSLTGQPVIGTVGTVPVEGVQWYIVAQVETDAAEASVDDFRNILIVGTAIFVVIIAFFAVAWGRGLMRPVRAISERLGSTRDDHEPLVIPEQSPIEMHRLAESFESMSATLDRQRVDLALARERRLELMHRMLPPTVADRIASGDLDHLDDVPSATVAVVVVLGLGDLLRLEPTDGESGSSREVVDRLHGELDELADEYGIDRVKVVGDAYFAACGHDRPFIDHAPRIVNFCIDARDAIRAIGADADVALDLAAGIHTGTVTVGMAGGDRLVYDVWGDTVTTAHLLARRAPRGHILVSDTTHAVLPDEIACSPRDQAADEPTTWDVDHVDTLVEAISEATERGGHEEVGTS